MSRQEWKVFLLGGHPNMEELEAGHRADGMPVSKWNVKCDEACCEQAAQYRRFLNSLAR
jgi:hypothetical protein